LPNETARYVPRFLATLHIVKDPQRYGFDLSAMENLVSFETVRVNKVMKLKDIAEKIEVSEEVLNLLNAELRQKLTPDREYKLKIPEGYGEKFRLIADEIPQSTKPRFVSAGPEFIKHKVKRGETIASIARKYRVSSSKIISHNKIRNKNKLVQGQVLTIPTTSKRSYAASSVKEKGTVSSGTYSRYKVKRGDTLSAIAGRFGMTPDKIRRLNNLKTDKLYVGQVLKIQKGL
jgi:membrane-bound lytic murein transglycosylase D